MVDISDALSEQDKVKFTVHTKTTLKEFKKTDFTSVREHEEFVWLHDRFVENDDYAGIIVSGGVASCVLWAPPALLHVTASLPHL